MRTSESYPYFQHFTLRHYSAAMNLSYLPPIAPSRPPRAALHIRYGLQLLLHHLLHADRVHQQFEILEDFKLMAGDI